METKYPDTSESTASSLSSLLLVIFLLAGCGQALRDTHCAADTLPPQLVELNLRSPAIESAAHIDSLLALETTTPTAKRIGLWARRFLASPDASYLFGVKPEGYVAEGLIVQDHKLDCVSLMYRCTELARAHDHRHALAVALATRFAGADPNSLSDPAGRLDYDHPAHLDYSIDMIRSGHWGRDVTRSLTGAKPDAQGTSRYPADSVWYVPQDRLRQDELREGDVVWLILSPTHKAARRLRDDYGLMIGHLGLVVIIEDRPWLVHAASSDLEGWYSGGRVVAAPLSVYLERVERYYGIKVTRF
ncbi:MAG: DUF1460 domain-containing protein [bacterium]|nr:DUF1460 domain-containing protein [bacterium]